MTGRVRVRAGVGCSRASRRPCNELPNTFLHGATEPHSRRCYGSGSESYRHATHRRGLLAGALPLRRGHPGRQQPLRVPHAGVAHHAAPRADQLRLAVAVTVGAAGTAAGAQYDAGRAAALHVDPVHVAPEQNAAAVLLDATDEGRDDGLAAAELQARLISILFSMVLMLRGCGCCGCKVSVQAVGCEAGHVCVAGSGCRTKAVSFAVIYTAAALSSRAAALTIG